MISAVASVMICTLLASSLSLIARDASDVTVRSRAATGSFYGPPTVASVFASKWSAKLASRADQGIVSKPTYSKERQALENMEGAEAGLLIKVIVLLGMVITVIAIVVLVGNTVISFRSNKNHWVVEKEGERGVDSEEVLIAKRPSRSMSGRGHDLNAVFET